MFGIEFDIGIPQMIVLFIQAISIGASLNEEDGNPIWASIGIIIMNLLLLWGGFYT